MEAGSAHLVPGLLVANNIVFYTRVRIDFRLRRGLARLFPLHIFPSIQCGCIGQAHVSPTVHQIYLATDNDRQTPRILGSCQGPVCISPSSLHRPSVNLCNSSRSYAGHLDGDEQFDGPELVFRAVVDSRGANHAICSTDIKLSSETARCSHSFELHGQGNLYFLKVPREQGPC